MQYIHGTLSFIHTSVWFGIYQHFLDVDCSTMINYRVHFYIWLSKFCANEMSRYIRDIYSRLRTSTHGPLTRYLKLRVAHAQGMSGTFSPPTTSREPLVSDPGMHHGICVMHVPWCMPGSLTRGGGENASGIPGACITHNFAYLVRGPGMQTGCGKT